MKSILIFLPNTLKWDEIGMLEGFTDHRDNELTFYVTRENPSVECSRCVGYCSDETPEFFGKTVVKKNRFEWVHINSQTGDVQVNNVENDECGNDAEDCSIVCISYDYEMFRRGHTDSLKCQNYGEHFKTLIRFLNAEHGIADVSATNTTWTVLTVLINLALHVLGFYLKMFVKLGQFFDVSVLANHAKANILMLTWMLTSIKNQRQVSVKVVNAIVAKVIDFTLGFAALYCIFQYEAELLQLSEEFTESVILNLEELLNFLMGAPVGLKLNYSFNKTLGTFFLYHISLWRTFLRTTHPLLIFGLRMLALPGAFGLSYQIAVFSDLIAFVTFHVYCIYVCAARLYGLQLKSLISLWRLFIGRKYNPLRKRIDSHQYTHHQLFIGTLGFTLLLFLMPTSIMYYTVFTTFRILLIAMADVLIGLRYVLQCLPLHITSLWLINSKCIRGEQFLKIEENPQLSCFTINASFHRTPFWKTIKTSLPDYFPTGSHTSWRKIIHNAMTGNLL